MLDGDFCNFFMKLELSYFNCCENDGLKNSQNKMNMQSENDDTVLLNRKHPFQALICMHSGAKMLFLSAQA